MAKATRKKKEKAADFSKAKLKLGKGKAAPTNGVDTAFKARSIALPSQSIATSSSDAGPTTRRKLSLETLLQQLKHYAPATRRDALGGLRELLSAHPSLLAPSLARVLPLAARLAADDDASVRAALLALLRFLLPAAPRGALAPHARALALYAAGALTHVFRNIAVDAVRLLELLLDYLPGAEVATPRVLGGLLGLLGAGAAFDAESTENVTAAGPPLSPPSRALVLTALARFLRAFLAPPSSSFNAAASDASALDTAFLRPHFATPAAHAAFDALLRPPGARVVRWTPDADMEADFFVAELLPMDDGAGPSLRELAYEDEAPAGASYHARLARALHPTLLASFLDTAPSAFSPSAPGPEHDLSTARAVADIYRALYTSPSFSSSSDGEMPAEALQAFLAHAAPYFPFRARGAAAGGAAGRREDALDALDLAFCALAARLRPAQLPRRAQAQARALAASASAHLGALLDGAHQPHDALARTITASAYAALVPAAWALLAPPPTPSADTPGAGEVRMADAEEEGDAERRAGVLAAVLAHAARAPSGGAVGALAREFAARLVLLPTAAGLASPAPAPPRALVHAWTRGLPRALWELGGSAPHTARTLRILLRVAQRVGVRPAPGAEEEGALWDDVAARLAPFFHVTRPGGGVRGPYAKLAGAERRLALDVAATAGARAGEKGRAALAGAVVRAVEGEEGVYWAGARGAVGWVDG